MGYSGKCKKGHCIYHPCIVYSHWHTWQARFQDKAGTPQAVGGLGDNRMLGEADLERLFSEIVLRAGKGNEKLIALTFDDGPDDIYTCRT